jgi:STE24 endopeptidase
MLKKHMGAKTILILYIILFSIKFIWETFLELLNQSYIKKRNVNPPEFVNLIMDENTFKKASEYTIEKSRFSVLTSFLQSVFLLILILSGFLGYLETVINKLGFSISTNGIVYIFSVSLIFTLFSIPFSIYSQFVIEEKYGFNKMTPYLFIIDLIKSLLISAVLMAPLLYLFFWFVKSTGDLWWFFAFLSFSLFQIFMIIIYPLFIAPIFNKFTPLENDSLKEKILDLAEKLKFKIENIFIMDGSKRSKHGNAYFTGIGKSKRIVFFDTLVNSLNEEELIGVLAHEIGHEKKKHILKNVIFTLLTMFAGFWIMSILLNYEPFYKAFYFETGSFHALIVLFLFCAGPFTFFLKPLISILSRKYEYEADKYAVQAVNSINGLKNALINMSRKNLKNITPHPLYSFYYYSHPTIYERITALERIK